MVFGELGNGKSTTLNKIVKLIADKFFKGDSQGCDFRSMQSVESVTSCVEARTIGNMTLIDTPGVNDPNLARSNKNTFIEMIKSMKQRFENPEQGISSLILCFMPNESLRLTDTTVKALKSMLMMFNSLDDRITLEQHPKYHIVINNVSRFNENEIDNFEEDSNETGSN